MSYPKLSVIDEEILTILLGRELYGLEILDQLNLDRPETLMFSSLYPGLNRLEKKGYVTWRWGDENEKSGGARRKYYKVTATGVAALKEMHDYISALAKRNEQARSGVFSRIFCTCIEMIDLIFLGKSFANPKSVA